MYEYRATVVRWVDGDTVDLNLDLGFRVGFEDRFRLFDPIKYIDTPERGEANYAEARAICEKVYPPGSTLVVKTHMDKRDKYGRWLVQIPEVVGALEAAGYLK